MERDLIALLLADAGIAALVSRRIHWNAIPQGTSGTCIVMYLISGIPEYTMSGPEGLESSRVQIDIRAGEYSEAISVRNALQTALFGYAGTFGNTKFQGAFIANSRQRFDKPGNTVGFHVISTDYEIWHRPA